MCLLAAALAAGCLPAGAPPAGRQLVADRTAVLAGILPPTGDGMVRVLFTRPGPNPQPDNPNTRTSDLYVVSVDANGGPPSERLLAAATQGVIAGPCMQGQNICYPSDARGRVFVTTFFDPSTGQNVVERIDPVTGDRLDAHNGGYYLSPSGRRLLVYRTDERGASTGFTLYEADDRMTVVDGMMTYGVFIGDDEDLIYLSVQHELTRIPPGGAPEVLATGISGLSFLAPTNALLLLARPTADPAVQTASIFDPVTLQETSFPFSENAPLTSTRVTASPDGRWLLDVSSSLDFTITTFTFVERATGAVDVFHLPGSFGNMLWRPGRAQLWIGSSYTDDPTIWIKTPGGPAVSTSGWQFGLTDATNGSRVSGVFTADGAYWFNAKFGPVEGAFSEIQLASADDPDGPRLDLVRPDQTDLVYWQLADGRILMTTYKSVPARSDIYAFDLATGDARLLGEAGRVTAVGRTRLLATLHVIDNLGDLTAVELASGRSTPLAPEFTVAAYVEPVGADRVAPGAHVAYQFQARFASPYDGIWVATVP